ncbi:MAG: RluA family pseudouridine synthase [candidate division Zixibacteria bacterium]|nr:RluA family pseudouridine synthase [candidate division Zixibacteria bacterium]
MNKPNDDKTYLVPELEEVIRLDKYLTGIPDLDISRTFVQTIIADGNVQVDGKTVSKKYKIRGGETINLSIPPPVLPDLTPENIPLDICYEDESLAVINKPAGLIVHPAPGNPNHTLANAVLYHFGNIDTGDETRPGIVHRLDKDTTGLIVIAKNDVVARNLQKQFSERTVIKIYHAIVCGNLPEESGTIDQPIGRSMKDRKKMAVTNVKSREAITHYKVLSRYRMNDYAEIKLETGRTHQIRVHLTHINRAVFGDDEYGGRKKWLKGIDPMVRRAGESLLRLIDRQALHAKSIEFTHPVSGEIISVSSDLPDDIKAVKRALDDRFLL